MKTFGLVAGHLAYLGLLVALFLAPGVLFLRAVPAIRTLALPKGLLAIGLGSAVWMYLLFAMSALHLLIPVAIYASIAVFLLAALAVVIPSRRAGPDVGG